MSITGNDWNPLRPHAMAGTVGLQLDSLLRQRITKKAVKLAEICKNTQFQKVYVMVKSF